jgi:glycerol-3-phosphate acyltransferase PlsY
MRKLAEKCLLLYPTHKGKTSMQEVFLIIFAYLLGSIPSALIISKRYFNIDIRDYGSGNMGATNTFRVLGSKFGTIVMCMDMLKGIIAASLYVLIPYYLHNDWERTSFIVVLGLASVIGHIFPIFAGFRGGKGVATLTGMLFALQPVVALSCVGVFLFVLFLTRYVSLSSMLAGVALPIFVLWIWGDHVILYRIFAVAVAILVIVTHKKNIVRLLKGVESQVPILKYRDRRKSRRRNDL